MNGNFNVVVGVLYLKYLLNPDLMTASLTSGTCFESFGQDWNQDSGFRALRFT